METACVAAALISDPQVGVSVNGLRKMQYTLSTHPVIDNATINTLYIFYQHTLTLYLLTVSTQLLNTHFL